MEKLVVVSVWNLRFFVKVSNYVCRKLSFEYRSLLIAHFTVTVGNEAGVDLV